jgi:hypothetical protein
MALKEGLGRFFEGATGAGADILQMLLMEKLGIFGNQNNQAGPQGQAGPENIPSPLSTGQKFGGGLYDMPSPPSTTAKYNFRDVRRKNRRRNEEDGRLGSSGGAYPI